MPAVVSYGIRLVSRAICISSVLTSSRSVSRSACSAELFVFCSYSEYLAASEKYRRMQSGRLQKARSLRCRPQTPTRRGSRRDRRCSIAYPPEADRRHRPVMNTAHFDLRSHILRSDRRCSAEGMRSGSAHWNPSSPPARGGGEMLSTPYPLHRPFSTKCRKDFFRKELHTLLGLGKVVIHKGHCGEMRNSGIDVLLDWALASSVYQKGSPPDRAVILFAYQEA